jgi:hypothetical protein
MMGNGASFSVSDAGTQAHVGEEEVVATAMHRPTVPGAVTLGRVLLIVESSLWILGGLMAVGFGALIIATAWSDPDIPSIVPPGAAEDAGAVLVGLGMGILGGAGAGLWSGIAMGSLTRGPRGTGIALASVGALLGLGVSVSGFGPATAFSSGPLVLGLTILVPNVVIIWALGLDERAQAAFRGLAAGGYPVPASMGYGPPMGYPPPPVSIAEPPSVETPPA